MTKKKSHSPELKAKVVRDLVEGDDSVGVVAARHRLNANMISGWRKQLFDNAQVIFAQDQRVREIDKERREHGREVDDPSRVIGQLTVERDHPQRSLGKRLDELGLWEVPGGAGKRGHVHIEAVRAAGDPQVELLRKAQGQGAGRPHRRGGARHEDH